MSESSDRNSMKEEPEQMAVGCNALLGPGGSEGLLARYGITRDPPPAIHEDVMNSIYTLEKVWSVAYPEFSTWLREMENCQESQDRMSRNIPLGYRLQLLLARWRELGRPVVEWPHYGTCRDVEELGEAGQWLWLDVLLGVAGNWIKELDACRGAIK